MLIAGDIKRVHENEINLQAKMLPSLLAGIETNTKDAVNKALTSGHCRGLDDIELRLDQARRTIHIITHLIRMQNQAWKD